MNLEQSLGLGSVLLTALVMKLRQLLKRRAKLSVSFQTGNGTSLTVETISSSQEDQRKED
jgi:hypothetical protein